MVIVRARRPALQAYYTASSVEEALAYLMAHRGEAQVVAGGTALMPVVQRGDCRARHLVDISRVGALKRVAAEGAYLTLGGGLSFAALAQHEMVRRQAPLLQQAAEQMGTPAVRSLATLGGNLVSADGHAHGSVALLALEAEAEITNATGSQWLPARSLFVRPGLSRVDSTSEIITALRIPTPTRASGAALGSLAVGNGSEGYRRAPAVAAVTIALAADGLTIAHISAAIGRAGRIPQAVADLGAAEVGGGADDPALRQSFAEALVAQAAADTADLAAALTNLALDVFDRALAAARRAQGGP
ncbi:MAG: FAD binding domain-containing protein [Chloroflexota bacterium]